MKGTNRYFREPARATYRIQLSHRRGPRWYDLSLRDLFWISLAVSAIALHFLLPAVRG